MTTGRRRIAWTGITALLVSAWLIPDAVLAKSSARHQADRPDLFHPETGLRIARQRAPTPDDVPGAQRIDVEMVLQSIAEGAVLLDVGPALQSRFDDLDGAWLVGAQHMSLPGAVWLPEVGRGSLEPVMQRYLSDNVANLVTNNNDVLVVFCQADCWMSWNAVQRLTSMGYTEVRWYAEGVDGWLDQGWKLVPVDPVPVNVD